MGRFKKFMLFLNVLVIIATIASYLSPYISPVRFWQFSFFGLVYPWLLLSNLLFIFYWLFLKKKWVWISLVCVLLGWNHIGSFVGLSFLNKKEKGQIKIVSYNIYNFGNINKMSKDKNIREKKKQEAIDFLKQGEEIQIMCSQETAKYYVNWIKDKFNFPHHYFVGGKSAVIFSKYPIFNSGIVNISKGSNSCLFADLKIGEKKLRVYNLHLQSNQVSNIADKVAEKGDPTKKELYKDVRKMMSLFRFTARLRAEQAQKIANHIATCPHPVIVCGDFNDTPQSYTYQTIAKNLKDTFKEKGRGFGTTYAGNIPALHIDHILVDKKIEVHSLEILKGNYSDHYPVVSKISLPR